MGLFKKGGFLDKLWNQGTDAITSTFTTSVKTGFLSSLKSAVRNANSALYNINVSDTTYLQDLENFENSGRAFTSNYTTNNRTNYNQTLMLICKIKV